MEWHAERQLRLLHDVQSNYYDPQYGSSFVAEVATKTAHKLKDAKNAFKDTLIAGVDTAKDTAKISYLTYNILRDTDYAVTIIGESFLVLSEHFGCSLSRRDKTNVSPIIDHLFLFLVKEKDGKKPITRILEDTHKTLQTSLENNFSNFQQVILKHIGLTPKKLILLLDDWIIEIMSRVLGCKYQHNDPRIEQKLSKLQKEAKEYAQNKMQAAKDLYNKLSETVAEETKIAIRKLKEKADEQANKILKEAQRAVQLTSNKVASAARINSPITPKGSKSLTPEKKRFSLSLLSRKNSREKTNKAEASNPSESTYKGTPSKSSVDFLVLLLDTITTQMIIGIFSELSDAMNSVDFATKTLTIGGKAAYNYVTDKYFLGKILFEIGARLTAKPMNIPVSIQERLVNTIKESIDANEGLQKKNLLLHPMKKLIEEKSCTGCKYIFWDGDENNNEK